MPPAEPEAVEDDSRQPHPELDEARRRLRDREQQLLSAIRILRGVREHLEEVERSRSWRLAHATVRLLRRARGRPARTGGALQRAIEDIDAYLARRPGGAGDGRRPPSRGPRDPTPVDPAALGVLARDLRQDLGAVPELHAVPLVSIVVVTRDGIEHLRVLFDGLERATSYDSLQLVVVDNGSTDSSVEFLRSLDVPFEVIVEANDRNAPFSAANNQGAARASGSLLLFLNNDVRPFEPGWLTEMVACHQRTGARIVGARLLHARRSGGDWRVQHRGIRFELAGGLPRVENLGDGEPLRRGGEAADRRVPAVTGACLLIAAEDFNSLGGFEERYDFGLEDVDLGLSALAAGASVVSCERAVLLHDESSTQRTQPTADRRAARRENRAVLLERWGPSLRREIALDQLAAVGRWSGGRPAVKVVAAAGDAAWGAAVEHVVRSLGWAAPPGPGSEGSTRVIALVGAASGGLPLARADLVLTDGRTGEEALAGAPAGPVVTLGSEEPHADRTGAATRIRAALERRERALRFCIKIGARDRAAAGAGGDLHFARSLLRALERRGHACRIQVREDWHSLDGLVDDVVLQLRGRGTYLPTPGQLNVLWCISHPDELSDLECEAFDLVCVASEQHAAHLSTRVRTPVAVLAQATDPWVFRPNPVEEYRRDLVFVGNATGRRRRIVEDLLPTPHDFAVWGRGWEERVDARLIAGTHLANDELAKVYSSARIVLSDHWDDMRRHGFISNRIYDALACGTLVISDHVPGLPDQFGDAVLTYRAPDELRALVARLLDDPAEARRRAAPGRRLVLDRHTFAHRAERLLELVTDRLVDAGPRSLSGPTV